MSDDLITAYEKRYQADSRDPSQAERLGVWTAAWNAATQGTGLTLGSFRAWPTGISAALGVDPADPWRGLYDPARMPKLDGVNDYHVAHPDLPKRPEDDERGISPLVKAQGFELEAVFGDYTEEGADDPDHDFCAWLAQWKPVPPAGDHWRLVCIQDTEDGPAALYVRPLALIDASPKSACHPDDAAVDAFAAALKAKLADARAKGRRGWRSDEPGMQQRLSDMLRAHVNKGDPRDVANFCMFLHQRGERISVPAPIPRPMDTAPRDGTVVRLLVQFEEHLIEDTDEPAWTIGACNDDLVPDDERTGWQVAGWCWDHDHFTEGKGTPVGWLPMLDSPKGGSEARDAARWRHARKILPISVIEDGQAMLQQFGGRSSEAESLRADAAIDAAMRAQAGDGMSLNDLPGMWEKADLIGGATDVEDSPRGRSEAVEPDTFFVMGCPGYPGGYSVYPNTMQKALEFIAEHGNEHTTLATWRSQYQRRDYTAQEVRALLAGDAEVQP